MLASIKKSLKRPKKQSESVFGKSKKNKQHNVQKKKDKKVTDKFYDIMSHQVHLAWVGFELTTLVMIGTDCIVGS